jgi:phosphatidylinositol kinase/protein kinase (PI-3  family)
MGSCVLGVPEFIPFRLTPQFTNVLRPLDSVGLLSHHCELVMRALRAEVIIIIIMMMMMNYRFPFSLSLLCTIYIFI